MDLLPKPIFLPLVEVVEHDPIRRKVVREHAPKTACAHDVEDRIHDLAARIDRSLRPGLGLWDESREPLPLRVGQICGVTRTVDGGHRESFCGMRNSTAKLLLDKLLASETAGAIVKKFLLLLDVLSRDGGQRAILLVCAYSSAGDELRELRGRCIETLGEAMAEEFPGAGIFRVGWEQFAVVLEGHDSIGERIMRVLATWVDARVLTRSVLYHFFGPLEVDVFEEVLGELASDDDFGRSTTQSVARLLGAVEWRTT